jgi:hypothetical protein
VRVTGKREKERRERIIKKFDVSEGMCCLYLHDRIVL